MDDWNNFLVTKLLIDVMTSASVQRPAHALKYNIELI